MLEFAFMRKALIAGLMLTITIPMIGAIMVNRKTSMIGDALSHTALSGVGLGPVSGFDPLLGSTIVRVVAAFLIELIRKEFPQYGDMATAVIMSTGPGTATILSDFAPGGNSFESYLFGSISSVANMDVINISVILVSILAVSISQYAGLLAISIDKNIARLMGVKVNRISAIFTSLSTITIVLAMKVVSALMVTFLIVLPVATALIIAKGYKKTYIITIILGVLHMMLGIVQSYQFDTKPGGAIVVNTVTGMIVFVAYSKIEQPNRRNFSSSENNAKIK